MRRATKAIIVIVAIGLAGFFLFAPVVYWFSYAPPLCIGGGCPHYNVYRSLGCITIGLGDVYSTEGLQTSCNPPSIPN